MERVLSRANSFPPLNTITARSVAESREKPAISPVLGFQAGLDGGEAVPLTE